MSFSCGSNSSSTPGHVDRDVVVGSQLEVDICRFLAVETGRIRDIDYVYDCILPPDNYGDLLFLVLRRSLIQQVAGSGEYIIANHEAILDATIPPNDDKTPARNPVQLKNVVATFVAILGPKAEDHDAEREPIHVEGDSIKRLYDRLVKFGQDNLEIGTDNYNFLNLLCEQEIADVINQHRMARSLNEVWDWKLVVSLWLCRLRKVAKIHLEHGRDKNGKPLPEKRQAKAIFDVIPKLLQKLFESIRPELV